MATGCITIGEISENIAFVALQIQLLFGVSNSRMELSQDFANQTSIDKHFPKANSIYSPEI